MPAPIIVQVLSDLHAEHHDGASLPSSDLVDAQADIVILAGDIGHARRSVEYAVRLFPHGPCLVLIAGNHEHYGTAETIDQGIGHMRSAATQIMQSGGFPGKIAVLEDNAEVVEVRGVPVRLLGSTLWTDFALMGPADIGRHVVGRALNDHRMIRGDGRVPNGQTTQDGPFVFTTQEAAERHSRSRAFLSEALDQRHDGPTIVVTHHLPSLRSVTERFRRDPVSAGFASRADDLLEKGATLWVHGHTHDSCTYRGENRTLVLCNPAGYARHHRYPTEGWSRENGNFDPRLTVDLRLGGPNRLWEAGLRGGPK